jgi:hypothetical protein
MQKRLDLAYKRKLAEYAEAKEKWEDERRIAKSGGGKPPGDKPEPPIRQTVFTSDATIEAIAELIDENPRGLLVACDELAAWLGSFARYKAKGAGTDLPRWLSMHSAGGFAYHRRTGDRRRIVVPHAAVSVLGGVQPGILARVMAGEFLEAGLAGRLLPAMPPRPAKVWSEMEIDPDTENRYHGLLDSLYRLDFDCDGPHVLKLSAEAKAAWVAWYNAWGQQQASAEGELAAAFSKLEEAAARFALVHHVVCRLERGESDLCPVEADSIEAGITLARWFACEARRVYATLAESEEDRNTRRLVEFIQARRGTLTARSLQRSNTKKYPNADAAELALEALAQAGFGVWAERPATEQGGRPTRSFALHPTADKTDTTSDDGEEGADDLPQDPSDTTPDTTPPTLGFSTENRGCVSNVGRRAADSSPVNDGDGGQNGRAGFVGRWEVVSDRLGQEANPVPPAGARLYFQDDRGRPCEPAAAYMWTWDGAPTWYRMAEHPIPSRL